MNTAAIVILSLIGAWLILFFVVFRIVRKLHPFPIPWQVALVIDNPLRRILQSPPKAVRQVGVKKGMKVLELGPGSGYLTLETARQVGGEGRLYCLDIEPRLIARLKQKITGEGLENVALLVGDGQALPFRDSSFDLAFMVAVLGEVPDKDALLQELSRVLRPGGILSITEMLPDPDYSLSGTTITLARRAGFQPFQKQGNLFTYVVNFHKPNHNTREVVRNGKIR